MLYINVHLLACTGIDLEAQVAESVDGRGKQLLSATIASHSVKILLPSARHLAEGRGTTILELPRLENCISRLCSRPLGCPTPPPPTTPK